MQKEGSDIFSYRFDSSYGAYLCMGGTLSANDDGNGSVAEVVPVFSLTQWLDDSNKLDSRWRDVFQTSSIDNGQLISIGKNVGFWWGIR